MAVAWDAAGNGTMNNASGFTISITGVGDPLYGVVGIAHLTGAAGQFMPTAGITWNADVMTVVAQVTQASGNRANAELWEFYGVDTGAQTITGTFSQGGHYGNAMAMTFTGVDSGTPRDGQTTGTTASSTGGPSTITATTSRTDDRIVDVNCWDQTATVWTAGSGQDAHGTAAAGGLGSSGGMSEEAGNATVPASTWTWSGTALSAQAVLNVRAAASGITGPLLGGHLINGGVLLGRLVR